MGWTVPFDMPHRADLIADRVKTQEQKNSDGTVTTWKSLAHCYRGGMRSGVLYIVWEVATVNPDEIIKSHRFIEIDLLKYGKDNQCGSTWGYKDMTEECGPYNYSCPLSYLDMVPEPDSEYARNWRKGVREYHDKRRAQRGLLKGIGVGDTIVFKEGVTPPSVVVSSVKPLRGEEGWKTYRINKNFVASVHKKPVTV